MLLFCSKDQSDIRKDRLLRREHTSRMQDRGRWQLPNVPHLRQIHTHGIQKERKAMHPSRNGPQPSAAKRRRIRLQHLVHAHERRAHLRDSRKVPDNKRVRPRAQLPWVVGPSEQT